MTQSDGSGAGIEQVCDGCAAPKMGCIYDLEGATLCPECAAESLAAPMVWVRQEDAEGCGVAVLAMLTDDTYANVRAGIEAWEWGKKLDLATGGITSMHFDRYLTERGYFIARRYDTWGMPMEPFAPRHVAMVKQPSGNRHFVAVQGDGTVLDPMQEGRWSLVDRPVMHLVGVMRP